MYLKHLPKCLLHSKCSIRIKDIFIIMMSLHCGSPPVNLRQARSGVMGREGFLPVSIFPIIWVGSILPLREKLVCSAPPPRDCPWVSVSLFATPQWGEVPAGFRPRHPQSVLKSSTTMHRPPGLAGRQALQLWAAGMEPHPHSSGL